jgi:hypothetical protein
MALNTGALFSTITSTVQGAGFFAVVLQHEPKSAPQIGEQVTFAYWLDAIRPVQSSGLNSVSVRVDFLARTYQNALTEPADAIDPALMITLDRVLELLCGDFQLGGNARYIDILGSDGEPLRATTGYITQDSKIFRTVDISFGVVVNDAWTESP